MAIILSKVSIKRKLSNILLWRKSSKKKKFSIIRRESELNFIDKSGFII